MAKDKKAKKKAGKLPKALRGSGSALARWAQTPVGREVMAAGLVAVAGLLASDKKIRAKASAGAREAGEAVSDAASGAKRLGGVLAAAATDAAERLAPRDSGPSKKAKGKKRKADDQAASLAH